MTKQELAEKIENFLATYGKHAADNPKDWASPDASELDCCAKLLRAEKDISRYPWSEWGSGGYAPYSSKEGRAEHDEILSLLEKHIAK